MLRGAYRRILFPVDEDREAIERLRSACGCGNVQDIGGWKREECETVLRKALGARGSTRQLARLTDISKAFIERIART